MRTSKYVTNKKPLSECSDKELKEVMSIARMHAVRKQRRELADDFASHLMEDIIRQGYLTYNLQWRWAEFLRGNNGNLAHKKGRARALAERRPIQLENIVESETRYQPVDQAPLPDEPSPINLFASRAKGSQERAILILRAKWGFTDAEIAEVFGVSTQRINQVAHTVELRAKAGKWI